MASRVVIGSDRKRIQAGDRVIHFAMILRDGPRHRGEVLSISFPEKSEPFLSVKMEDGRTEKWGTCWTADGPWNADTAEWRTDRGRKLPARGPR